MDDAMDAEIIEYISNHAMLLYDYRAHAALRRLVEHSNWDKARELVAKAIQMRKSHPIQYALGILGGEQMREAAAPQTPAQAKAARMAEAISAVK